MGRENPSLNDGRTISREFDRPVVEAGVESRALIQNIDYAPTFLQVAGLKAPDDIQGRSIFPTGGVECLRRGLGKRENAGLGQACPFFNGN